MQTVYTQNHLLSIISSHITHAALFALVLSLSCFNRYFLISFSENSLTWNAGPLFMFTVLTVWLVFLSVQKLCTPSKSYLPWFYGSLILLLFFVTNERELIYFLALVFISLLWLSTPAVRRLSPYLLTFIACLFSMWGIAQFSLQQDLGLYQLGETHLSADRSAIAKFSLSLAGDGTQKVVRAYGPFSHANTYGGILALGFATSLQLLRVYQKKLLLPLSFILLLGIVVSFSRSAWLAAFISLLIFTFIKPAHLTRKITRVMLAIFVTTLLLFTPLIAYRMSDTEDRAASERLASAHRATHLLSLKGIGVGSYEKTLRSYMDSQDIAYNPWEVAPAHSAPLLFAVEWGIVLTVLLSISLAIPAFRIFQYRAWHWLLPLIPLLALDHYFATQLPPLLFLLAFLTALSSPMRVQDNCTHYSSTVSSGSTNELPGSTGVTTM